MNSRKGPPERGPLDEVGPDCKARLAFQLLRISAEMLDLLGQFDHIDRSWVHNRLYLSLPKSSSADEAT